MLGLHPFLDVAESAFLGLNHIDFVCIGVQVISEVLEKSNFLLEFSFLWEVCQGVG